MTIRKLQVYKAEWREFLKYCEKEGLRYDTLDELCDAADAFIAEALRIRTKYDN